MEEYDLSLQTLLKEYSYVPHFKHKPSSAKLSFPLTVNAKQNMYPYNWNETQLYSSSSFQLQ